jgi:hypothetical protein
VEGVSESSPVPILGVVTDDDGRPVADAAVSIEAAPVAVPDIAALTGADGSFSLPAPVTGRYTVTVVAPGFRIGRAVAHVDIERSTEVHLEVRLASE